MHSQTDARSNQAFCSAYLGVAYFADWLSRGIRYFYCFSIERPCGICPLFHAGLCLYISLVTVTRFLVAHGVGNLGQVKTY